MTARARACGVVLLVATGRATADWWPVGVALTLAVAWIAVGWVVEVNDPDRDFARNHPAGRGER